MRSKPLKQLRGLKNNEFIDNKLNYYLKSTEAAALRLYSLSRIKPEVIGIGSYSGFPLNNLNKYIAIILKA